MFLLCRFANCGKLWRSCREMTETNKQKYICMYMYKHTSITVTHMAVERLAQGLGDGGVTHHTCTV